MKMMNKIKKKIMQINENNYLVHNNYDVNSEALR